MKKPNDATFTFRLPKDLKTDAHATADVRGEDLADALRQFLRGYVK